ncbi:AAA family ATPase [Streptococcus pantholopis]|uniref:AAA+ ATPase domain-containing protein n=1 Tax=Streptococcus pantholopis TaxID=1811193 RepID=A0A172Q6W8_9STRE|nr:AAA family ATPase [Streptococcus pantholopis]AND79229.1 hypothetical protein A0O21_03880 [Streptococcus pantholopis]
MKYYRVQTTVEGEFRQELDVHFLEKYGYLYFPGQEREIYIVSNDVKSRKDLDSSLDIIYKNPVDIMTYDSISDKDFTTKVDKEKLGIFGYFLLDRPERDEKDVLTVDYGVFSELETIVSLDDFKEKITHLVTYLNHQNQMNTQIEKEDIFLIFNGGNGTGKKYAINFLERLFHLTSVTVDGSLFFLPKIDVKQFPVMVNFFKTRPRAKIEFLENLRLKESANICLIIANSATEAENIRRELYQTYYKIEIINFPNYDLEALTKIGVKMLTKRYIFVNNEILSAIIRDDSNCRDAKKIRHLAQDIYHFALASDYDFSDESLLDLKSFKPREVKQHVPPPNAQIKLDAMIGLERVKSLLKQQVAFSQLQKLRKNQGIQVDNFHKHLVFSGNPGTGKTEVARLYTDILYHHEIIRENKLVEVGRADLIGEYVGHTAPKVKRVFNSASGGVLFIDEAYSLIPESERDFANEAISAVIQEMENRRDEVLVIFAGYRDLMRTFIKTNPGLQSRISREIYFEDYSIDELYAIFQLMLRQKSYSCSVECGELLKAHFSQIIQTSHFGNARYVRKVIDSVVQHQAIRIMNHCNAESLTKEELNLIIGTDIELAVQDFSDINKNGNVIGFRMR